MTLSTGKRIPRSKLAGKELMIYEDNRSRSRSNPKSKRSGAISARHFTQLSDSVGALEEEKEGESYNAAIAPQSRVERPHHETCSLDKSEKKPHDAELTAKVWHAYWGIPKVPTENLIFGNGISIGDDSEDHQTYDLDSLEKKYTMKMAKLYDTHQDTLQSYPTKDSTLGNNISIADDGKSNDFDDCLIIGEKLIDTHNKKTLDNENVLIPEVTCKHDQVETSKRWEFEWVEVDMKDNCITDDDKVCVLSPLEWEKLTRKQSEKGVVKVSRSSIVVEDLSQGRETVKILAVNEIVNERPAPFTYITEMKHTFPYKHSVMKGCGCKGGCSDTYICECVKKNGGKVPFNEEGGILRARKKIYECGPNCKCPPSCQNRVSQHGSKLPLEVFKTESTGWGVRSRKEIKSGSFICEYLGELIEDEEADRYTDKDEYLFDLGDGQMYTVDAAKYGNVARFINHNCSPNLYAQDVFYDDERLPHVMFFATENIPAFVELTYHYNYKVGSICDAHGNIKEKNCFCRAPTCTGKLY